LYLFIIFINGHTNSLTMNYSGDFQLNAPREKLWGFLTTAEEVSQCFPGITEIKREGEGYRVKGRVGIGPIRGDYNANFKYTELVPQSKITITARGTGMGGSIDLSASVMIGEGSPVKVSWIAELKVGGVLASLGARVMDSVAKKMVEDLFQCMKQKVEGS